MNAFARYLLLSTLFTISFAQAGLFDWFKSAPTYQIVVDAEKHIGSFTGTTTSISNLEEALSGAAIKNKESKFGTFAPLGDGQFVVRWQKKDSPTKEFETRVLDDRKATDLLLPEKGQIAEPYEKTFFVYYGSPKDTLFSALLPT